jgi:hypothetical protein
MTWLCNKGLVACVVTEDSDMVAFGCATVRGPSGSMRLLWSADVFSSVCARGLSLVETVECRAMHGVSGAVQDG